MSFPHSGKMISIDQLNYYDPQSQTFLHNTISSMTRNNTIPSSTDVSPRVYKDSMFLGAYYGPLPTPSEPRSSSAFMHQASCTTNKHIGIPSLYLNPMQPPYTNIFFDHFQLGTIPLGLYHAGAIPLGHYTSS